MPITLERLNELLECFTKLHITMLGDLFLDRWYEIDPERDEPSLETGIAAWQVVQKRSAPGAGGNVLNNLSAMEIGHLEAISFLGDDGDGWELRRHLKTRHINTERLIVSSRLVTPTYIKPLFPKEGHRLDIKNFEKTPSDIEEKIIEGLKAAVNTADAVILLDQVCEEGCGVLTPNVRKEVSDIALRHPNVLFFADSRAFIDRFQGVIIKCNHLEAAKITHRESDEDRFDPDEVFKSMEELTAVTGNPVVVTCGAHGIAVKSNGQCCLMPAVRHSGPIDICGAGDASTAALVSALCAGATLAEAACIANLASGVTVRKLNQTGTASRQEMLAMFREQNEMI